LAKLAVTIRYSQWRIYARAK